MPRNSARETFHRSLRHLEKQCVNLGVPVFADIMREIRLGERDLTAKLPGDIRDAAAGFRRLAKLEPHGPMQPRFDRLFRRSAWIRERMADAVETYLNTATL